MGVMNCSWGHLEHFYIMDFWGAGEARTCLGDDPHLLQLWTPSPLGSWRRDTGRAYSEPPAPTLTRTEALPAQEAGLGSAGGNQMLRPAQLGTISHGSAAARSPSL